MTITKLGALAGAIMAIGTLVAVPIGFFETKTAAAEAKAAQAKSVSELRVEVLMHRVKQINDKPKPTADDKLELQLLVEQIKALQAEQVRPKK